MIYDSTQNHALYERNERYKKAFEFLLGYSSQAPGRYEICDGVYAMVQERSTEPAEKRQFEAHRRYADIQYCVEGSETIGVSLDKDFEVSVPYNAERDIEFYEGRGRDVALMPMRPGHFLLLYPHDFHMPLIGDGGRVRKIVVKVLLDD